MRVTVEPITFEEFTEATVAMRRLLHAKQKRAQRRSPAVIVFAVMTAVLMFGVTSGWWSSFDRMPERRPPGYAMTLVALPILGLILLTGFIVAAQLTRSKRAFAWRLALVVAPTAATFALVGVLLWLTDRLLPAPPGAPRPPVDWYGTLAPHAGWFLIALMIAIVSVRGTRRQSRRMWETQPTLTRIKDFDITSTGVRIDECVTERTYQWPAFVRFIETPNLLILCPSDVTYEILPKRAFASPDDLQTARDLFASQVETPGAKPAAFPVLPAKPPSV